MHDLWYRWLAHSTRVQTSRTKKRNEEVERNDTIYGVEDMTKKQINIEVSCVECGVLTPDSWLFETDKPHEWVCGDCVDVDSTLTLNEEIVEFLRQLKEGTN